MEARLKRRLKDLIKIAFGILICSIFHAGYIWWAQRTPTITLETVQQIEETIEDGIIPSIVSESYERVGVYLYTEEYTHKYLIVDKGMHKGPKSISLENDAFYQTALRYHRQGLCYIAHTVDIPMDTRLYTTLNNHDEIRLHNYVTTCPIIINDELAGYVLGVVDVKHRLYDEIHEVTLLSREISHELQRVLYGRQSMHLH